MKKIAFLLFSGKKFGGMERRYARVAYYLAEENKAKIIFFATGDSIETLSAMGLLSNKYELVKLDSISTRFSYLNKINRLIGFVKFIGSMTLRRKYDHVHLICNPGVIAYIYCLFAVLLPPVSVCAVNYQLKYNPFFLKKILNNILAIDCLSENIADYVMSAAQKIGREKVVFCAPCSFTDYSKVVVSNKKDIDVLMLARFTEGKGYDLLIKSIPNINDCTIHACGFGPNPPVHERIKAYNTDDPFEVLSRTRIFLSIQQEENYPSQSLLEAMASGCAIIATDVGLTRKMLDNSCSILINYSSNELSSAINYLLENRNKIDSLGSSAKKTVLQNHTIEKYADYFSKKIINL